MTDTTSVAERDEVIEEWGWKTGLVHVAVVTHIPLGEGISLMDRQPKLLGYISDRR